MVLTKAPLRLALFGGGTDFSSYFQEEPGAVLACAINHYAYAQIHPLPPYFSYNTQVSGHILEQVSAVSQLSQGIVRESLGHLSLDSLQISLQLDLPAQSGLGSSSALSTALLLGLHQLKNQEISPKELAKEAIFVERTLCQEAGGWQDQILSSFGGFCRVDFSGDDFQVSPLPLSSPKMKRLEENLLLVFSGITRLSADFAKEREESAQKNPADLKTLYQFVGEGEKILSSQGDLDQFGLLMEENWQVKRGLTKHISSSHLDDIYDTAKKAGALGGKLMGAGGGGFFLFYVPKDRQEQVKIALAPLQSVPFSFEAQGATLLWKEVPSCT